MPAVLLAGTLPLVKFVRSLRVSISRGSKEGKIRRRIPVGSRFKRVASAEIRLYARSAKTYKDTGTETVPISVPYFVRANPRPGRRRCREACCVRVQFRRLSREKNLEKRLAFEEKDALQSHGAPRVPSSRFSARQFRETNTNAGTSNFRF